MKIQVYQQRGSHAGKMEMEDRAVANGNLLAEGYHCMSAEEGVFGVMDGVGGQTGSAYASARVGSALTGLKPAADAAQIRRLLEQIHEELYTYTQTATTATGFVLAGDVCTLFHIGNTRLYLAVNNYLRQETEDQTEGNRLLHSGVSMESIDQACFGVLSACIGLRREMTNALEIRDISDVFRRASRVLLCSDGVHDFLSEDRIEAFLQGSVDLDSMAALAEDARKAGSLDDISILTVEKIV